MGKIRVQDLARMMSISNQDLVFKMKSIGVRVEGDDAHIDSETLQAIIQGKKLPHPREVILRDEPAASDAQRKRVPAPAPAPSTLRPPANPLRPGRPRTLIQKVEPRIQTLPASERPERALAEAHEASEALEAQAVAESVETRAEMRPEMRETVEAPAAEPSVAASPAASPVSPAPETPGEAPAPAAAPSAPTPSAAPSTTATPAAPAASPTGAPAARPPVSSPSTPYRPATGPGQGRPSGPYPPSDRNRRPAVNGLRCRTGPILRDPRRALRAPARAPPCRSDRSHRGRFRRGRRTCLRAGRRDRAPRRLIRASARVRRVPARGPPIPVRVRRSAAAREDPARDPRPPPPIDR